MSTHMHTPQSHPPSRRIVRPFLRVFHAIHVLVNNLAPRFTALHPSDDLRVLWSRFHLC